MNATKIGSKITTREEITTINVLDEEIEIFLIQNKLNYHSIAKIMIPIGNLCQPTYLLYEGMTASFQTTRNLPNGNIGSPLFCDRKPYVLWQNGCLIQISRSL